MTMNTKSKTISEFRTRFTDPATGNTHTVTSNDLDSLQGDIKVVLGNVQFDKSETGNTLIVHAKDSTDQQALGWISSYEVPQNMSVKHVTQAIRARAA